MPSFFVKDASIARALFWHRAQIVKRQTTRTVKSPFLPTRTLLMAKQRETSSIRWEREADEQRARPMKTVENGLKELNVKQESGAAIAAERETEGGRPVAAAKSAAKIAPTSTVVPQTALMGLSMLGSKRRARLIHRDHSADHACEQTSTPCISTPSTAVSSYTGEPL